MPPSSISSAIFACCSGFMASATMATVLRTFAMQTRPDAGAARAAAAERNRRTRPQDWHFAVCSVVLLMQTMLAQQVYVVKPVGTLYSLSMIEASDLRMLARRNKRDKDREAASYAALVAAIWQASDNGWRQTDIVREVGLTRERVRQICDDKYRAKHDPSRKSTDT